MIVSGEFRAVSESLQGLASGCVGLYMNKLSSIAFTSLLFTAACGDIVQTDEPADLDDGASLGSAVVIDTDPVQPKIIAASCAELRAQDPAAEDADYTLYVGGDEAKPFTAWCQDMATTPLEYLRLENVMGNSNFAQYTAGGASSGDDVRTYYFYLRIDPATLVVNTSDQRFAMSDGTLSHSGGGPVTSMPYGVAMGCGSVASKGLANIDLRGTHFAVNDTFRFVGSASFGVIAADGAMTTIDIEGGGFCGWMAPANTAFDPMNTAGGSLQLAYLQ